MSTRNLAVIAAALFATTLCQAQSIKMVDAPYNPVARPVMAAPVATAPAAERAMTLPAPVSAPNVYEVTAEDKTLRDVLGRWSRSNGWGFEAEHWTIDRDYPVQGAASASLFGNEFKQAVRVLLSSTEMTDQAAQPCFYSNYVLRVIPIAAQCNRADPN